MKKNRLWLYLTGQSQWAPKWTEKLPAFCLPVHVDHSTFKWLGRNFNLAPYSYAGDTLFMSLRRRVVVRATVCLCHLEYDLKRWLERQFKKGFAVLARERRRLL